MNGNHTWKRAGLIVLLLVTVVACGDTSTEKTDAAASAPFGTDAPTTSSDASQSNGSVASSTTPLSSDSFHIFDWSDSSPGPKLEEYYQKPTVGSGLIEFSNGPSYALRAYVCTSSGEDRFYAEAVSEAVGKEQFRLELYAVGSYGQLILIMNADPEQVDEQISLPGWASGEIPVEWSSDFISAGKIDVYLGVLSPADGSEPLDVSAQVMSGQLSSDAAFSRGWGAHVDRVEIRCGNETATGDSTASGDEADDQMSVADLEGLLARQIESDGNGPGVVTCTAVPPIGIEEHACGWNSEDGGQLLISVLINTDGSVSYYFPGGM